LIKIAVKDASIVIDLCIMELFEITVKELNWNFVITDMVRNEISKPIEAIDNLNNLISLKKITIKSFKAEEIIKILELKNKYPPLSLQDCSCLYYAKVKSALLLTCDNALRKSASKEFVQVMGTLGVLDCLVKKSILSPLRASISLKKLLEHNKRLPLTDCQNLLEKWGKG
jgi:predicted nucleic acid-binding protein